MSPQACLQATSTKEAEVCLKVLPISFVGLGMDDDIAVGLRLGATLCTPRACHHCGAQMEVHSIHGLSCRLGKGHHYCHTTINDIIHRVSFHICRFHSGRNIQAYNYHMDGKYPDGITVVPWKCGKLWDVTCLDSLVTRKCCQ